MVTNLHKKQFLCSDNNSSPSYNTSISKILYTIKSNPVTSCLDLEKNKIKYISPTIQPPPDSKMHKLFNIFPKLIDKNLEQSI